jgi:hypothetical protein
MKNFVLIIKIFMLPYLCQYRRKWFQHPTYYGAIV